jgi:hypothetical protein
MRECKEDLAFRWRTLQAGSPATGVILNDFSREGSRVYRPSVANSQVQAGGSGQEMRLF